MKTLRYCSVLSFAVVGAVSSPIALEVTNQSILSFSSSRILAQEASENFDFENFDFWVDQCILLSEQRNYEEGLTACETAIALKPNRDNLSLWMARGQALFHLGQYADSLVSLDQIVNEFPNHSLAIAYQCANFFQLNRYGDAVDVCENALRIDGDWDTGSPAFAWYYRGLALQEQGRLETALFSFEQALRIEPDDPLAYAGQCTLLAELELQTEPDCGLEETVIAYEQAIASNPNNAVLWIQQGLALEQLHDYQRALTSYERALDIHSAHHMAQARQCGVLNQLGDFETALAACKMAVEGDEQSMTTFGLAYAWSQHSAALIGLGEYEDALASAERGINIAPDYPLVWNSHAVSLWHLNQYPEAISSIAVAINLYNDAAENFENTFERTYSDPRLLFDRGQILAWFNQGRIWMATENYPAAAFAYQRALDLTGNVVQTDVQPLTNVQPLNNSTLAQIWSNHSAVHFYLGNSQQALESAIVATQLDPEAFSGWFNYGLALVQNDEYDQALDAYARADQLNPNNVQILTGMGMAFERMGEIQDAITAYNQALNLDPNYAPAQRYYNALTQPR